MTHHTPAPTTTTLSSATTAWVWGGSAILVSGLLRLLEALPISAVIGWRPVTLIAAVVFAIGAVILLSRSEKAEMGDTERALVRTAAGFLGRQMEQ